MIIIEWCELHKIVKDRNKYYNNITQTWKGGTNPGEAETVCSQLLHIATIEDD